MECERPLSLMYGRMRIGKIIFSTREVKLRKYRNYKENLIEKLKDPEYTAAYLNACLEESVEAKDMGIFQLALCDVVEAHDEVMSKDHGYKKRFKILPGA